MAQSSGTSLVLAVVRRIVALGVFAATLLLAGLAPDVAAQNTSAIVGGADKIGKDLQDEFQAQLTPAVTQRTAVTITSSPASTCRVSATDEVPGTTLTGDMPPRSTLTRYVSKGRRRAGFWVQAVGTGICTLEISASGYPTVTRTLTLDTPTVRLGDLPAKISRLAPNVGFTLRIGAVLATGRYVGQEVRPTTVDYPLPVTNGKIGIPIKVCSSYTPAGTIVGGTPDANCSDDSFEQQDKSIRRLKFDPNTEASTDVCVVANGVSLNLPACQTVQVVSETISILGTQIPIGVGLQSPRTIKLSKPAANDGWVTLASADSNVCVVSKDPQVAGALSDSVQIKKGRSSVELTVQVKGTASPSSVCQLTPSVDLTGYTSVPSTIEVFEKGLRVINVDPSQTSQAPNDPFNVVTGVLTENLLRVRDVQAISKTESAVTITVCSSNTGVAQILGDTPNCVELPAAPPSGYKNVSLAAGASRTDDNALILDLKLGGNSTVSATAPGFSRDGDDSVDVVVTDLIPQLKGPGDVGEELEVAYTLALNGAVGSTTPFRVESSDTGACKLSAAEDDLGVGSIYVNVLANRSSATFYVHGMDVDDPPRSCVVSAAADPPVAGIEDGAKEIHIVQPGLRINGLPSSIKMGAADKSFTVSTGVPDDNAASTGTTHSLADVQELRTHDPAALLAVTACSPDADNRSVATHAKIVASSVADICGPATIADHGDTTATNALAVRPVSPGSSVVYASASNFIPTEDKPLTVGAAVIDLNRSNPDAIGAALQDSFTVYIDPKAATSAGVPVTIDVLPESQTYCALALDEDAPTQSAQLPLTIAKGKNSKRFAVRALVDPATMGDDERLPCHLKASSTDANYNTPDELVLDIVKPGVRVYALGSTTTIASANDPFYVHVGVPNDSRTNLRTLQTVWGTSGQAVKACSRNTAVGLIQPQPSGTPPYVECITATVSKGDYATVANAVAFDPVGIGTTKVDAEATGFIPTAFVDVNVAEAILSFPVKNLNLVGAGLMDTFTVSASTNVPVATNITITSNTPDNCLVAVDESSPAADTVPYAVTVQIGANNSSKNFAIHGIAPGPCELTATAPPSANLTTGSQWFQVLPPAVRIDGLGTSKTASNGDDGFQVQVGVARTPPTTLQFTQKVRMGASAVPFTICSSDPYTGVIVAPNGSAAACLSISIPAGRYDLASSDQPKFRATGNGLLTVSVDTAPPNYVLTDAAYVDVTVSGFALTINASVPVGSGLQRGFFTISRNGPSTTPLTVTVTTTSATYCKLAASSSGVGGTLVALTIPAGATMSPQFWIQGEDNVTLAGCQLQATGSLYSYTAGAGQVNIVKPGVRISGLLAVIDVLAANDPFNVEIGVPNGDNSNLLEPQQVRNNREFQFTVTNAIATYGQLTSAIPPSPGQSVTVKITGANSQNTASLEFDPLAVGNTQVSVSANSSVVHTTAADVVVSVTDGGGC